MHGAKLPGKRKQRGGNVASSVNPNGHWRFGVYEVDARNGEVRRGGTLIKLREQSFCILVHLLEHPGELVTREDLRRALWPSDTFVDFDHSLNTAVMKLREALGDSAETPLYIETIPKRGYRFVAPVSQPGDSQVAVPPSDSRSAAQSAHGTVEGKDEKSGDYGPVEPAPAGVLNTAHRRAWPGALIGPLLLIVLVAGILWRSSREGPHQATEHRVTSNPPDAPVRFAVVSPDGKYVAYSDPTGLYLRQISNGETHRWDLPKDFVACPNSWFPDGAHLLVTRCEGADQVPGLWKLSLLTGTPLKLMDKAAAGLVSPDGSRIAYLSELPSGSELWLMNADGANPRRIAAPDKPPDSLWNWIYPLAWSPAGRRIAYLECHRDVAPDPAEGLCSLRTQNAGGGDLTILSDDPGIRPALYWASDGRIFYAYSGDPGGERNDQDVYSIRVDERTGKAVGSPLQVTKGQGRVGDLSANSDGKRLVFTRQNTADQVFITEIEADTNRLQSPQHLTLDANGNVPSAWTYDSKAVLFVSNRNGRWTIFKQAIDETTADVLVEGHGLYLPRLSPDGSQVLYLSYPPNSSLPVSLMRKPLEGGPAQTVLQEKRIANFQCARAPSQLCIFSKFVGGEYVLVSFDLQHGASREVTRVSNGAGDPNWVISPDGEKLALFIGNHQIRFFSLKTGLAHDVRIDAWPTWNGDWSADSKGLFVPIAGSDSKPLILFVTEAGNAEVVLRGDANTRFNWLIPSPDGRYGALRAQIPGDNNVWMVDTF